MTGNTKVLVGVLSDTHGRLSNRVRTQLQAVDLIIHAGDFDTPDVLETLQQTTPLIAVRGNMDIGAWAKDLPAAEYRQVADLWIYVMHDPYRLDIDPQAAGCQIVINGHTHQPAIDVKDDVLYLNPGSATYPRRYPRPSMILLKIEDGRVDPQVIYLQSD